MPTYEYVCDACGKRFEKFHKMSETLHTCPDCGGPVIRQIGSGGGIIFKGKPASRCGQATPCCGRETRCDKPPCQ